MKVPHNEQISNESYFFRDAGQFALFKNAVLPAVMEANRSERSLRIWSAGCSTGEEPYSIAIILKEVLPRDWKCLILGTDADEQTLRKAREGVYTEWSFRKVDPEIQRQYFHKRKGKWALIDEIRSMVTFRLGDLIEDDYPSVAAELHHMDIIFCRNVFIYHSSSAISTALEKLSHTLSENGYLITGHGELNAQRLGPLRTRMFPDSIIYQKVSSEAPAPRSSACIAPAGKREQPVEGFVDRYRTGTTTVARIGAEGPGARTSGLGDSASAHLKDRGPAHEGSADWKKELEQLLSRGAYGSVVEKIEALLSLGNTGDFEVHFFLARAYSNLGRYDPAARACRRAISLKPMSESLYFLLAQIAEMQENGEEAKESLKKAIYLAPGFVAAYLELAAIYEREGNAVRARKMRSAAMRLLETTPPEAIVEPYGNVTCGELLQTIKRALYDLPG